MFILQFVTPHCVVHFIERFQFSTIDMDAASDNLPTSIKALTGNNLNLGSKGKMKKTEKRSRNFSNDELEIIMDLAGKHSKVLLSRFSPTVTNERKKKIWMQIARVVNGINGFND